MVIKLMIDRATREVNGYSEISEYDEYDPDDITIDVDQVELPRLIMNMMNGLLYCDLTGSLTVKDEPSEFWKEKHRIYDELSSVQIRPEDERAMIMDNVVNGMPMDDAVQLIRDNRKKAEELKKELDDLMASHEKDEIDAVAEMFIEEEKGLSPLYLLSMVAVVRDENPYLEEWIRYYVEELGFEHFYIYDNESTVPVKEYLIGNNFKYADMITYIDWKSTDWTQQDSCNHFLKYYSSETKWVFVADPDEYITLADNSRTLREYLKDHSEYATIRCPWQYFTANGQEKKTDEPDMVRFTEPITIDGMPEGGKYFGQTNRIKYFGSYIPYPRLKGKTHLKEKTIENGGFFQLNHYYTRSYEEWVQKIKRGSVHPTALKQYLEFFKFNPDMEYLNTGENFFQEYCPPTTPDNTPQ